MGSPYIVTSPALIASEEARTYSYFRMSMAKEIHLRLWYSRSCNFFTV